MRSLKRGNRCKDSGSSSSTVEATPHGDDCGCLGSSPLAVVTARRRVRSARLPSLLQMKACALSLGQSYTMAQKQLFMVNRREDEGSVIEAELTLESKLLGCAGWWLCCLLLLVVTAQRRARCDRLMSLLQSGS